MDSIESVGSSLSPSSVLLQGVDSSPASIPSLEDLKGIGAASEAEKRRLARDFESVFLTRFFDEIRESIGNCSFDDEDPAGQQIYGMFWSYLAQDVAEKGGFGLSEEIYRSFQDMDGAEPVGSQVDKEI